MIDKSLGSSFQSTINTHNNIYETETGIYLPILPSTGGVGSDLVTTPARFTNTINRVDIGSRDHNIRPFRIISWNIAGICPKLSDEVWLEYVKVFDIICIQETWNKEDVVLDGYCSFNVHTTPSPAGRAKGGVVTLISVKYGAI